MPTYEIYKRDGTPVRVEGPEGATTQQLINLYLQQQTPTREEPDTSRLLDLIEQRVRSEPSTILDQATEAFIKGPIGGALGLVESGLLGAATVLPEVLEAPVRSGIQTVGGGIQSLFAPDPNIGFGASALPRKFGEALGSFAGLLGTAALNPLAAGALAVGAGAGEASERAREGDATSGQRALASLGGAGIGVTELISPLRIISKLGFDTPAFLKLTKGLPAGEEGEKLAIKIGQGTKRAIAEGGVEGGQEFAAAVGQNLIERGLYNPEQDVLEGSGEAAGIGGGVGAFVQVVTEMIAPRRGAKTTETEDLLQITDQRDRQLTDQRGEREEQMTVFSSPKDPLQLAAPSKQLTDQRIRQLMAPSAAETAIPMRDTRGDVPIQMDKKGPLPRIKTVQDQTNELLSKAEELRGIIRSGEEAKKTAINPAMVEPLLKKSKEDLKQVNDQIKELRKKEGLPTVETQPDEIDPKGKLIRTRDGKLRTLTKEEQQQEDLFKQAEEEQLKGFAKEANNLGLNESVLYANLDKAFTGVRTDEITEDKRKTDRTGVSDDVGDGRRQATGDTTRTGPLVGKGLEDAGKSIPVDVRRKGQRDATLGLTATERGKVFVDQFRGKTDPTKILQKSVKGLDAAKAGELTKFLPLPEKEINARIENINNTKPETIKKDSPKAYLYNKIDPKFQYIDFMERTTEDSIKIKKAQRKADKEKQDKEEKEAREQFVTDIKDEAAQTLAKKDAARQDEVKKDLDKQFGEQFEQRLQRLPKEKYQAFRKAKEDFSENLKENMAMKGEIKATIVDPTTAADKKAILNLFKPRQGLDETGKAAKMYFGKVGSILQGIEQIVYDATNLNQKVIQGNYKGQEVLVGYERVKEDIFNTFEEGAGSVAARRAQRWMLDNLGDNTNAYVLKRLQDRHKENQFKDTIIGHQRMNKSNNKVVSSRISQDQLAMRFDPEVMSLLESGNLKEALEVMYTPNDLGSLSQKLAEKIGDTKIKIVQTLETDGSFDPKTNTIELNPATGMNPHVLLHEVAHAVTSATLANKSHPMTKQLNTLYKEIKGNINPALSNVDEFVAEAMSNPSFQSELSQITSVKDGTNIFQRFTNIISNFLKRLTGKEAKPLSAMDVVSDSIEGLIAPAPRFRDAPKLNMFSSASGTREYMKRFSENIKEVYNANKPTKDDPKFTQRLHGLFYGLSRKGRNLFTKVVGSQDLGRHAREMGFGQLGLDLDVTMTEQRGAMDAADRNFAKISEKVSEWYRGATKEQISSMDRVIYNEMYGSTIYQVDPNKPRKDYVGKTDNDGNPLDEVWDKQRKDWDNIGKEGQKTYNSMQQHYKDQHKKLKDVFFGEIDSVKELSKEGKEKLKKDIFQRLFAQNELSVYFPLMRRGKFKLSYRLKEKEGRDNYVMQMFETPAQRNAELRRLKQSDQVIQDSFEQSDTFNIKANMFVNAPSGSFVGDTLDILNKELEGNAKAREEISNQFMKLYIETLPETSFAKSLQPRLGTPGYLTDSLEAFRSKGFDLGRQIERVRYTTKIRQIQNEIRQVKEPDAKKIGEDVFSFNKDVKIKPNLKKTKELLQGVPEGFFKTFTAAFEDMRTELLGRADFAMNGAANKDFEHYVKTANQSAFLFTIGFNPSSAFVNLSQIPVFVAPFLGGQFGYKKSAKQLGESYKTVMQSAETKFSAPALDSFYDINEETGDLTVRDGLDERIDKEMLERIKPVVKEGLNRGQLNRNFVADTLGLGERGRTQTGSLFDKVTGISALMFNAAERINRQVTLLSSYELVLDAINSGKPFKSEFLGQTVRADNLTKDEIGNIAAKEAIYMTQQLNGGSVLETAPSIAQQGIFRVAMMYKTFGLQMYSTMLKTARTMLSNDPSISKEEKKIAFKQLAGLHGTVLFVSGVHGLPLYGSFKAIAGLMAFLGFGDEDDDDFDTMTRKLFGELGYKGVIAELAGLDISDRVKFTGLLYEENRYQSDESLAELVMGALTGPAGSVAEKLFYRVPRDISEGEYMRALEGVLPTGFSNLLKATPGLGRVAREGYVTKRGDPIFTDVNAFDLVGIALGVPPTEYTFAGAQTSDFVQLGKALTEERTKLLRARNMAERNFDYEALRTALAKIEKYNKKVLGRGFRKAVITGDTIKSSRDSFARTTATMHRGASISPLIREALSELKMEYG